MQDIQGRWNASTIAYQSSPDGDADFQIEQMPASPEEATLVLGPEQQCTFQRFGSFQEGTYTVEKGLLSITFPHGSLEAKIGAETLTWMDHDEEHGCDVLITFNKTGLQKSGEVIEVPKYVSLGPARDEDGFNWDETTHIATGKQLFRYLDDGSLYVSSPATPEQLSALIASGFLDNLTSLDVDAKSKKLATLPPNIVELSKLRHVSIDSGKFTGWEQLYRLTGLTSLHLGPATGIALPDGISALSSLTHLKIEGKRVQSLPGDIGKLAALTHLELMHTKLTTLPAGLFECPLRSLKLEAMAKLSELGQTGPSLAALETLELHNTGLKAFPEAMAELPTLTSLSFEGAKLKTFPSCNFPKLRKLSLYIDGALDPWAGELATPELREAQIYGKKLKQAPPLTSSVLQKLTIEAPLLLVAPGLASVKELKLTCKPAALKKLSEAEQEAFGERLSVL